MPDFLTSEERNKLPDSDFALPGRKFPIHNATHARNALARAAQTLNERDQTIVKAKVKARYPDINVGN